MFEKYKKWSLPISVILLVLLIVINIVTLGTHQDSPSVKFSTNLSSESYNYGKLTFMPDNLLIDTIEKNGKDGQIEVQNSNVTLSGYSDIVDIFSPWQSPMTSTLSNVQFFYTGEVNDLDFFFSRYTQFLSCEVIELPSQVTIDEETNIITFYGGIIKYQMEIVGDSQMGLWEYNFKFWSNSEGTVKIADNCPLGYIPNSYTELSLDNISSFTLNGNRSIFHIAVETHSISFDNDLVISANTGAKISAKGFHGELTMTANTMDSRINEKIKMDYIFESDDLMIISRGVNSSSEIKAYTTEYGGIDVNMHGSNAEIYCNEHEINQFEFNNVNEISEWIINVVFGGGTIISMIVYSYKNLKKRKRPLICFSS